MPLRSEKRLVIALPLRIYGMGSDGKPFTQEAHTVDITRDGARVAGVRQIGVSGEIVGVQYQEEKARFRVMWVGQPGTDKDGQIGIQALEAGKTLWHKVLEAAPEEVRWTDPNFPPARHIRDTSSRPSTGSSPATPPADISRRVEQATQELKEIEGLIESGAVDGRILHEFREAVNHIRQTSWAVQKWLELRDQKKDPYSAVELLVTERIRCATQLARDLGNDVESHEVDVETEGLGNLHTEIDTLSRLLARVSGKAKS